MDFILIYVLGAVLILGMMTLLWLISLLIRDSSIVDIFWGMGFVLTNGFYFILTPQGFEVRKWTVGILVSIWGLRLSLHLLKRNWRKGEDFRYSTWRKEAGAKWWWLSFFKVFLIQGFIMWLISSPLLVAQFSPSPAKLIWIDYTALGIWAVGFFFEAVGDWQLMRFKANPLNKGKLHTSGLWRYTRHPNYFGDALQWWAYFLFALATGGFWTVISPLMMTFLLRNVSGVTLLEKTMKEAKPGYREYLETTNAFIPWFPRKK